jgi:hypothetical protein
VATVPNQQLKHKVLELLRLQQPLDLIASRLELEGVDSVVLDENPDSVPSRVDSDLRVGAQMKEDELIQLVPEFSQQSVERLVARPGHRGELSPAWRIHT